MNMSAGLKLFLGLLIAVGVGGVFVVPKLIEKQATSVSQPASLEDGGTGVDVAEPALGRAEAPGAETTQAADENVDVASLEQSQVIPSFDVLRVEPDGSTVIAGKAESGTTLNIMDGETVIASTPVGPSGDFAAVLDTPLDAGDYQLKLRTVGDDGATRESEEVATVSIPQDAGGELLAMVSKPGKASRIIAQPSAPEPAKSKPVAPESSEREIALSRDGTTKTSRDGTTKTSRDGTTKTEPAPETAVATDPDGNEVGSAALVLPELPEMSSLLTTSAPEIPAEPGAEPVAEPVAEPGADAEAASGPVASEPNRQSGDVVETEIASLPAQVSAEAEVVELPAEATVRVDAVEIEGGKIFIAGSATPGYIVQVFADGVAIGTDTASQDGRFIVEAEAELAVGDHFINADLMGRVGGDVLLRATVPFNRPEGEALAAVAPELKPAAQKHEPDASEIEQSVPGSEPEAPVKNLAALADEPEAPATIPAANPAANPAIADDEPAAPEIESYAAEREPAAPAKPADSKTSRVAASGSEIEPETSAASGGETAKSSPEALIVPDIAGLSKMREDAFEALTALDQMVSAGHAPGAQEIVAALSAAVEKLKTAATAVLPVDSSDEAKAIAKSMRAQAQAALAVIEPDDTDTGGIASADGTNAEAKAGALGDLGELSDLGDLAALRTTMTRAQKALAKPAEINVAASSGDAAGTGQAQGLRTIRQAPLASAPGAVIIRRGDTLWQISRRTYGQGVRYTTIYLANRSQIKNPDRIAPGQVFSVPKDPLDNSEELHRQRLKARR